MRDDSKKIRELLHLHQLNDHLPVLPSGDWLGDEEPDFLIGSAGERFGVEVTEYHSDQRATAREQEQAQVLEAAARLYNSTPDYPPVFANVYWNAHARFEKRHRSAIAASLCASVRRNVPAVGRRSELDSSFDPPSELPEQIDRLEINRYAFESNNSWYAPRAGFPAAMDVQRIQSIIDGKDLLAEKYRRKVDLIWLVIVYGRSISTTWAALASGVAEHRFRTAFDRLFLVSYLPPGALELVRGGS